MNEFEKYNDDQLQLLFEEAVKEAHSALPGYLRYIDWQNRLHRIRREQRARVNSG